MSATASASGGLKRAAFELNAPTGGVTQDVQQLVADEDREIVGVVIDDTGGSANVMQELSFRSSAFLGGANITDGSRAPVIALGGQGLAVMGLSIGWGAGEEIHLHTRNNSGATEQVVGAVYYRELE